MNCHRAMAAKNSRSVHPASAKETQLKYTAAMEQKIDARRRPLPRGNPASWYAASIAKTQAKSSKQ